MDRSVCCFKSPDAFSLDERWKKDKDLNVMKGPTCQVKWAGLGEGMAHPVLKHLNNFEIDRNEVFAGLKAYGNRGATANGNAAAAKEKSKQAYADGNEQLKSKQEYADGVDCWHARPDNWSFAPCATCFYHVMLKNQ